MTSAAPAPTARRAPVSRASIEFKVKCHNADTAELMAMRVAEIRAGATSRVAIIETEMLNRADLEERAAKFVKGRY